MVLKGKRDLCHKWTFEYKMHEPRKANSYFTYLIKGLSGCALSTLVGSWDATGKFNLFTVNIL